MENLAETIVTVADHPLTFAVMSPQWDGWTATIWLDEGLEHVVGEHAVVGFEDRLAAVPGIVEVEGEDREIVHVRSEGLTPDALLAAVLEAAHVGHGSSGPA